ncbi:hypothetical protein LTS18_006349 [Coniosporium uncinatum]|uniref:Uncharacterized protein n=1 Tax=Coniosporium uncinatum TaxID=93489 RepID=A0ACC3DQA7_9PEZI|nr:hypothetical protein LTS18_006349 [Coniosporium uncinatum]
MNRAAGLALGALGFGTFTTLYFYGPGSSKPLSTTATNSIEERWTAQGGGPNSTSGVASPLGHKDKAVPNKESPDKPGKHHEINKEQTSGNGPRSPGA